jgi:hypothetical protein
MFEQNVKSGRVFGLINEFIMKVTREKKATSYRCSNKAGCTGTAKIEKGRTKETKSHLPDCDLIKTSPF